MASVPTKDGPISGSVGGQARTTADPRQLGADDADRLLTVEPPVLKRPPRTPLGNLFLVRFYRSAVGKKWVMAITGIFGLGFVFAHMVGNLHIFEGPSQLDHYGEWLRELLDPPFPRTFVLWMLRLALLGAVVLHVHAAYSLTRLNHAARPVKYQSQRQYAAADLASRTMRWTGVIVLVFLVYHIVDMSFGTLNPGFIRGAVYRNVVADFDKPAIAIFYIVAMLALGPHLYHGAWSMFQSLGINNPRFNRWRRWFATSFAVVVTVGFIAVPVGVMIGLVD
jgi:succinate dehydrogenase / fumarate reductase cytochrome b subunit